MEVVDLQLFRLVDHALVSENASIESSGTEVEFAVVVSDNFSMTGTHSTLDAKFVGGTFDGNTVPRSPDSKYTLQAEYVSTLNNDAELRLSAGASYSDNYYTEATNLDVAWHDSYTKIDASAKYTDPTGAYTLEIWGKNLSDELITKHAIVSSYGGSVELYAPPRTFGVTVSAAF
jgi:iron complex outermembrane receptor protein